MSIPKYPEEFIDFGKGMNVSNEEINEWIKELIEELENNPKVYGVGKSTGNTYVKVDRDEIGKYRIFVTKNYQEKTLY